MMHAPSQDGLNRSHACELFLSEEQLRQQGSAKWSQYEADVLPCWVADMDFAIAQPVRDASLGVLQDGGFGYPLRGGQAPERFLADAFASRMDRRYRWAVDPDCTVAVTDLVQAIHAVILAFSDPGEGVIVHLPSYPPIRAAIATTRRSLVAWEPISLAGPARWAPEDLSSAPIASTRLLILCNPQNPTGRVFSKQELETIASFAIENDLVILSDEIHSDLVYPGGQHIPIATLGQDVANRTITLCSATKSFGIAGLRCAVMHFGCRALKEQFERHIPRKLLGVPGITGIEATVAAWSEASEEWLTHVVATLGNLRRSLAIRISEQMPELRMHLPEATYLAWIDCSGLRLDEPASGFFLRESKIATSPGEAFHPDLSHFVRLNFATSPTILEKILVRMHEAISTRRGTVERGS